MNTPQIRTIGTPPATSEQKLSPPDAQRAALRDLVTLAAESAATESRIERELAMAAKEAGEGLEKSTKAIRLRVETTRHQAKQKRKALLNEVAQKYAADLKAVRDTEEPARQRAQAELDEVAKVVTRKLQEATWLADSDLEVSLNTLAAEEKKQAEEERQQEASIDALQQEMIKQAVRFGYEPDLAALNRSMSEPAAESESAAVTGDETDADRSADGSGSKGGKSDALGEFSLASPDTSSAASKTVIDNAAAASVAAREAIDTAADRFRALTLPRLVVGVTPILILLVLTTVAGIGAWVATGINEPNVQMISIAAGGMFVVVLVIGLVLRSMSNKQVRARFSEVETTIITARKAARVHLAASHAARERARTRATHRRDTEVRMAQERYLPGNVNARRKFEAAIVAIDEQAKSSRQLADTNHAAALSEAEVRGEKIVRDVETQLELDLQGAQLHHDRLVQEARERYEQEKAALANRMQVGLETIHAPMKRDAAARPVVPLDWQSPEWTTWKPPTAFADAVRFGKLFVDLMKIARASADGHEPRLPLPAPFELPAVLAFPSRASLLVQADRDGRADAIRVIQLVMARLLVSLPPGRVRFTILDPIGLGQNFAGFMHLADHDEALVGGRIWTEADQIDQRLTNLTGHMETVIQKYLRNEFETIDEYNAQAGELAEPYRFLVVSDFPAGFSDEALRRLSSIASSGARCGVYTLVFHDTRQPLAMGVTTLDDVARSSVTLDVQVADSPAQNNTSAVGSNHSAVRAPHIAVWRDPVFEQFPLTIDPPPGEAELTRILDQVGRGAKEAARVEVPFETIAPPPREFWSQDSGPDVHVPIGRTGATRLQLMRLGKGVAQHVLIAGKTGSGKSTLLHTLVTNLAMWYSPQQVEFYLVDFKKGVEFKSYATHALPHARAIAVESDREFGLSVLQRLDAELTRRGELFRAAGVQDLAAYRKTPEPQVIPRTLLIVDEFQEFFSEDDKLAQESGVLLDRLVRQGRAFGIHCLLGSQTIGGAGLPRTTIGQMAVRVALQTSDADSQLILGDSNSAARLLSRPGEAIYNDQGGLVEGNSPFQIAFLSDQKKERYLSQIRQSATEQGVKMPQPIVFEGNAPADLSKNVRLLQRLRSPQAPLSGAPVAWVGEPVAIKDPTGVAMRRQSGANVLVIGQAEESALATLASAMISLAVQSPSARFYVFDATPADSTLSGAFARVAGAVSQGVRMVEWRATEAAVDEIAKEVTRRRDEQDPATGPIYLFINGLQRYRVLRKSEEEFSFGASSSEEAKPDSGKQFAEILKEGPPVGVHTFAWIDTAVAIDRTLDRSSMREFDNRVLFQMSANDSSNLIDSPAANKLGFYRALAYSEEQGVMEKFRPYALPSDMLLKVVSERINRPATTAASAMPPAGATPSPAGGAG